MFLCFVASFALGMGTMYVILASRNPGATKTEIEGWKIRLEQALEKDVAFVRMTAGAVVAEIKAKLP